MPASKNTFLCKCLPLKIITFGQYASVNINRMIQLVDFMSVLKPTIFDSNKRLILYIIIDTIQGRTLEYTASLVNFALRFKISHVIISPTSFVTHFFTL